MKKIIFIGLMINALVCMDNTEDQSSLGKYLRILPNELKMTVILSAVQADNIEQELKSYGKLLLLSKQWKNFLTDPQTIESFLKHLASKYAISHYQIALTYQDKLPLLENWLNHKKIKRKVWIKNGDTLFELVDKKDQQTIQKAVKAGSDPNIKDPKNPNSPTPLFYAVSIDNPDQAIVTTLLNIGADPNIPVAGWTPLIKAVKKNNFRIAEILLKAGANPNKQTTDSKSTALMIAAASNNAELVKLLLKHGAKKNIKNKNNLTALDLSKNEKIIQLLKKDDR